MEPIHQNLTKCENIYCKGISFDLIDSEFCNECGVCYDSLEGQEMAVLSDCDHAFCISCLQELRGDNWLFNCPYCKQTSYQILKTKNYVKRDQRMKLFKQHVNCFESDPIVTTLFQELSPIWREFIEKLLRTEVRDIIPFWKDDPDYQYDLTKINEVNRYTTCQSEDTKFMRLNINCVLPGVVIQFMLSNEDLSYDEVDNEHADKLINWLNRHYDESWSDARGFIKQHNIEYLMWRQFPKIHCLMNLRYNSAFPEAYEFNPVVEDNLNLFRAFNFKDLKFDKKIEECYYLLYFRMHFTPIVDVEQYLDFRQF